MITPTSPGSGRQLVPPLPNPDDIPAKAMESSNVNNQNANNRLAPSSKMGLICEGEVTRSTPGMYCLSVKTPQDPSLTCKFAPLELAGHMGAKNCYLPPEGTRVLVYVPPDATDGCGIVLATIPRALQGMGGKTENPLRLMAQQMGGESGGAYPDLAGYATAMKDKANSKKAYLNENRPLDVLPGDLAWITDSGGIMALLGFMTLMGASERARIESYVFDDLVRVVSGNWQHWHGLGETSILNDTGYVTMEMAGSWFYPETLGQETFGKMLTKDENKKDETGEHGAYQFAEDGALMAKRRFQIYFGALGDLFQMFVTNPLDGKVEKMDAVPDRPAMAHVSVRGNGEIAMQSAAGFSFERSDCVPTPKRLKDPADPEGNIDLPFKPKLSYEFSREHPYAGNLEHRDADAWGRAQDMQRFVELDSDMHVPEEYKVKPPKDEYDPLKSNHPFQRYAGRKAGFRIGGDGSLHLFDAWGGEIYMAGGVIRISAPGTVLVQSGGSIVNMGRDVVIKAKDSVDMTAEDHDIRVAARGNVHVLSRKKGILLESGSESDGHGFQKGIAGESVVSGGITLKADKSWIFAWGRNLSAYSEQNIFVKAATGAGRLIVSVHNISMVGMQMLFNVAKASMLVLNEGGAALLGRSVTVAGGGAVNITRDSEAMVPYRWVKVADVYTLMMGALGGVYDNFYTKEDWLGMYKEELRRNIMFTYRSTEEYGTDKPMEAADDAEGFKLYEAMWQHELQNADRNTLVDGSLERWKEDGVNGTHPWPGTGARSKAYTELKAYQYVIASLDYASWSHHLFDVQADKTFDSRSMDEYIIRKQ